jgi:hypothetical protein
VFHFCGIPTDARRWVSGSSLWHRPGSIFCGAGISTSNIPFSYIADWGSAGRWGIEFRTAKRCIILKPMEKLQIMLKGSTEIELIPGLDDEVDLEFKPGLYGQVESFLGSKKNLCSIGEQVIHYQEYMKMMGEAF